MANQDSKPTFACKHYPNCPDREETRSHSSGRDEDGTQHSKIWSEQVTGPCQHECWNRMTSRHIDHSVFMVVGGRSVDVGS